MAYYEIDGSGNANAPVISIDSVGISGSNGVVTIADNDDREEFLSLLSPNAGSATGNTGFTQVSYRLTRTDDFNTAPTIPAATPWTVATGGVINFDLGTAVNDHFGGAGSAGPQTYIPTVRLYGGEAVLIYNSSDSVVRIDGSGDGAFVVGIRSQPGKTNNRDSYNEGSRDVDADTPLTIGARDAVIFENTGAASSTTNYWNVGNVRGGNQATTAHGTVAQDGERIIFADVD